MRQTSIVACVGLKEEKDEMMGSITAAPPGASSSSRGGGNGRHGRRGISKMYDARDVLLQNNKSHAAQVMEAETLAALYSPISENHRRAIGEEKEEEHFDANESEKKKMDKSKQYQRDLLLQIEQNRERKRNEKEDERRMERIRMMSSSAASSTNGGRGGKVDVTAAYGRRELYAREKANAEYESALKMQIEEKKRRKEEEKRKMREMEIEDERRILRDLERMNVNNASGDFSTGVGARGKSKSEEPVVDDAKNVANVVVVVKEEEVGELLSFSEFVFPTTDEELDGGNT